MATESSVPLLPEVTLVVTCYGNLVRFPAEPDGSRLVATESFVSPLPEVTLVVTCYGSLVRFPAEPDGSCLVGLPGMRSCRC